MRMMEIVLVEMEAMQEIVSGLGKWTHRQKVSEKFSNPASSCGWFFYLQLGHLLLVYTGKWLAGENP